MMRRLVFALILEMVASADDAHAGHDHGGGNAFEWAGIFEMPSDSYTWTAQKTKGKDGLAYVDPAMKLAAIPVAKADDATLHKVESEGNHALESACTDLQSGDTITPMEDKCYKLVFDQQASQSSYTVNAAGTAGVAFFTEHFPTEFENDAHYLKDPSGKDIEPEAELPEATGHHGHDHGGDHDGHDHGSPKAYEWAGIFDTPGDWYTWTAQKTDPHAGHDHGDGHDGHDHGGDHDGHDHGRLLAELAYVDPAMKLAAIPVAKADDATLHNVEAEGEHSLGSTCTDLQAGGTIKPMKDKCYRLVFAQNAWQSLYQVDASGTAGVAFFTEHMPTEFENTAHYLKDPNGEDIEPVAELPEPAPAPAEVAEEQDDPWGPVMLASIIVNFITLAGVVLVIPVVRKAVEDNVVQATGIICGFAGGAILACAFFLLLFEATHLVAAGWDTEVEILWRWGTCALAGLLFPGLFHLLADAIKPPEMAKSIDVSANNVMPSTEGDVQKIPLGTVGERARLFIGVNFGDFIHNLCDGFFVAAAFKGCGTSFGWSVAVGTIIHEFPQELADYIILTGPKMGLSPLKALACNFLAGTAIILGSVIVLVSEIENDAIGCLLAFGGGVYIYIGAAECMPRMYAKELTAFSRMISMFMFIVGAVVIGLVLLDHEHCVPPAKPGEEPVDPHAGHHH